MYTKLHREKFDRDDYYYGYSRCSLSLSFSLDLKTWWNLHTRTLEQLERFLSFSRAQITMRRYCWEEKEGKWGSGRKRERKREKDKTQTSRHERGRTARWRERQRGYVAILREGAVERGRGRGTRERVRINTTAEVNAVATFSCASLLLPSAAGSRHALQ